ncbi:MAG: YihA family ribosome biogenesis GTP-binding protein, partial [Alphaproteobacteria bacterium]|nr:YihA family ribosome biogenesis GTP-binding protein [Alphaproteobacteria bacterium]
MSTGTQTNGKSAGAEADSEAETDDLEYGRRLFAAECQFIIGAVGLDQVPDDELPEVAFAGRSNVGKSSLINALTGRKSLARTSHSPGRTQELNFFVLGDRLMIADLPGYGYAKAPKQKVAGWTKLAESYLKGRAVLRRACLLIDARHGIKDVDRNVLDALDAAAVSYQIILTKCDKITSDQLNGLLEETHAEAAKHVAAHPDIIATSARKGTGIAELRATLAALAASRDTLRG